ncbi:uncharacterized protein LOC122304445 [Carya illinoinensis]|uniref:uncharacterized protein LOC122304445 n=1 Tax=Carya illinoinensis TaxID=32201 RepID=UPI001C71FED5|nr:uncharacterized protein LOC122304445 [Carya illinoinensis]
MSPIGEIHTIARGFVSKGVTSSKRKAHVREARYREVYSAFYCPTKYRRGKPAPIISFGEVDEDGVLYPHDDALVVTMQIANFIIRRILIDNISSADILLWEAFTLMGIDAARLLPAPMPLKGFFEETVQPKGTVGSAPCTAPVMVYFLVVRAHSLYNAIIGWPTLNKLKVITSTYHLKSFLGI